VNERIQKPGHIKPAVRGAAPLRGSSIGGGVLLTSVAVLQARTNSSRLPGKVLLPINGVSLAVLAAKRAANTGRQVIVVTSLESSDDGLASHIQSHGLRCFRGSLENTLDRVVNALSGYDEDTVVFRLTADNVFPDGLLLDELEAEFLDQGLDYLCCNGEPSGLPYGMSVEVTRLAHLREAARESVNAYDQEHVTPYVIRKFGRTYFEKYRHLKKGHYRCTIDCLDDYLAVQQVFADVPAPIDASSLELVRRLENVAFQPLGGLPTTRLVFGAAQLGGQYGIANKTGQPGKKACRELIKTAIANGVTHLDTARAYGDSEAMIGQSLRNGWEGRARIITKLSPLQDCPQDASAAVVNAFVDASVFQSCAALEGQTIDVLVLHRASHLVDWGGAAWQRLLVMQGSGLFGELGISVQSPEELLLALNVPEIRHIQLPFNLLDWRWDAVIPKILAVKASRRLTVHVRSALLQGLLSSFDEILWRRANVDQSAPVTGWLQSQVASCHRANIVDLCLSYVNALEWVDGIAIGMENMAQLIDNIKLFNLPGLTVNQIAEIQKTRPRLSEATLNPALWRE
jgi:spore coat polysaccharide biosynthesis protein SpsF (cytidylyltransferase family)/aryl-alcohol dehydrogenase-like predicted oxidoreductase